MKSQLGAVARFLSTLLHNNTLSCGISYKAIGCIELPVPHRDKRTHDVTNPGDGTGWCTPTQLTGPANGYYIITSLTEWQVRVSISPCIRPRWTWGAIIGEPCSTQYNSPEKRNIAPSYIASRTTVSGNQCHQYTISDLTWWWALELWLLVSRVSTQDWR